MNAGVDAAAALFTERFGGDPDGVWRAPGRVNLIGEHTDYNDGLVMPFAIDRATFVAARARDDDALAVVSSTFGDAPDIRLGDLRPERIDGWCAYVWGAVAEARALIGEGPGLDIAVHSDVPAGAGLSSSAALECSVASMVADVAGVSLERIDVARAAQRAEHRFAGVPSGLMDQLASMFGIADHVLLIDTRSLDIDPVPLAVEGHRPVVIDTRVRHALADGGYADRRRACERAAEMLGVASLRDVTIEDLTTHAGRLGDVLYRRARHVVTENDRVRRAARALRDRDHAALATAMAASHASLRDDFEVSSPELDLAVIAASEAGALAARMTGGGFGGSVIALVPEAATDDVRASVEAAFSSAGYASPAWLEVRASDGAARVR